MRRTRDCASVVERAAPPNKYPTDRLERSDALRLQEVFYSCASSLVPGRNWFALLKVDRKWYLAGRIEKWP